MAQVLRSDPSANPLRVGLRAGGATVPAVFVIFGATGDLAHRKLLPAIYNLGMRGLLPNRFAVVGYSRTRDVRRRLPRAAPGRRSSAFSRTPVDENYWTAFADSLHYQSGGFDDVDALPRARRATRADRRRPRHRGQPRVLPVDAGELLPGDRRPHGRGRPEPARRGSARVVIEKPFGHDLASARELAETVHRSFDERQVYRIDHYLGKETVQNIFVFRFANAIFEPVWTNRYVDHVQITVAESLGVEHRARSTRRPASCATSSRTTCCRCWRSSRWSRRRRSTPTRCATRRPRCCGRRGRCSFENTVRGQYGRGFVAGEEVVAYSEEENVPLDSNTPTFIAAKLEIDNWRWAGTPVLHPQRQAPAEARDRGGGAVQARAAPAVHDGGRGAPRGQLARAAHPARRGHLAALRRQGAVADRRDQHA